MNIGIDIDDTLCQLHARKLELLDDFIKTHNYTHLKIINNKARIIEEMVNWDEESFEKWCILNKEFLYLSAKVYDNAIEVLHKLRQDGHRIYIISARSSDYFRRPYDISLEWLTQNEVPFDELHIGHADKSIICKEHNISVMIDDYYKNINDVKNAGIKTILINTATNELDDVGDTPRVNNWNEIYDLINSYAE